MGPFLKGFLALVQVLVVSYPILVGAPFESSVFLNTPIFLNQVSIHLLPVFGPVLSWYLFLRLCWLVFSFYSQGLVVPLKSSSVLVYILVVFTLSRRVLPRHLCCVSVLPDTFFLRISVVRPIVSWVPLSW